MGGHKMNLYILSQDVNNEYDTYDYLLVCAASELDALTMPMSHRCLNYSMPLDRSNWCDIKDVKIQKIGKADLGLERGFIFASYFN